ncbi:MAG: toxin FitB [Mycobacterium sp.]|nr:toxin FitB [Mycobacterium sp.]
MGKDRPGSGVPLLIAEDFKDRVLPFDQLAAVDYANIVASRERSGRPISLADAQIAAICRHWSADLATRNVADFVDIDVRVVNPWTNTVGQ